jgi:hypothetical protein
MMRHRGWFFAGGAVVLLTVAALAAEKPGTKPAGPPPLEVDKSAPLLLDEPKKGHEAQPEGPVADNGACFVCHTNYQQEPLARVHAKANVGCVKCHGRSSAHRNDEDNITPPDIMYPAGRIDAACKKCHEEHNVAAVKVIARWQQNCPAKTDPTRINCTDCHGQHRLTLRTVRWDKETRKLLVRGPGEKKNPSRRDARE